MIITLLLCSLVGVWLIVLWFLHQAQWDRIQPRSTIYEDRPWLRDETPLYKRKDANEPNN